MEHIKQLLYDVEMYINYEGDKMFDDELAKEHNASNEVIEIGRAYNEMLKDDQNKNYESNNRKKKEL